MILRFKVKIQYQIEPGFLLIVHTFKYVLGFIGCNNFQFKKSDQMDLKFKSLIDNMLIETYFIDKTLTLVSSSAKEIK